MKIVVAPDSFKGSLSAREVAESIEKGVKAVYPEAEVIKLPMADGGEGTVEALVDATGGEIFYHTVTGPLGNKVQAFFGVTGDGKTAVIEMAAASGLPLVPEDKRNPAITTTYGTGELIKAALDKGCRKIILGIGGSATNDGGAGMAQALGAKLVDSCGREIGFGGKELLRLAQIDVKTMDPRLTETEFELACDVDNPLCGPNGASAVYGPQKGATPEMVKELDKALEHYAAVIDSFLDKKVKDVPGAGAGGGIAAGALAFLNARLRPGIEIVIETTKLKDFLKDADLVFTGEGKIDRQTISGKTPLGVARTAKEFGIPVIAVAGTLGKEARVVFEHGIDAVFSAIKEPVSLKEAMENTRLWLAETVENIMRIYSLKKGNV
ncbi:glycerate kinase [Calderihabitans maritimus]|uniref:Glycerate kinase n=1 Tax=Calderihabitans maritimus TaxID=1246530 RepID=A0A1Z5HR09_9FIRM|nr:glycerate kinase [Calderihabitans maritimus]GAW91959.1 Glycerate kinase [Calderihabitans maritimus]